MSEIDVEVLLEVVAAELPLERLRRQLAAEANLLVGLPGLVLVDLLEQDLRREVGVLVAGALVGVVGAEQEQVVSPPRLDLRRSAKLPQVSRVSCPTRL